ncbi:hypothetical protein BH23THE1_BH23THE1_07150 [soil metagenome]
MTKVVKKLYENHYLIYEKYRGLRLKEAGINININININIAQNIRENHSLFAEFLKMIGIEDDVAHLDAEGIEHHLHPSTNDRKTTETNPDSQKNQTELH